MIALKAKLFHFKRRLRKSVVKTRQGHRMCQQPFLFKLRLHKSALKTLQDHTVCTQLGRSTTLYIQTRAKSLYQCPLYTTQVLLISQEGYIRMAKVKVTLVKVKVRQISGDQSLWLPMTLSWLASNIKV